ncbi:SDR family NAD(P)-dependent oxidoreductase [Stackebrandtia nassauensis]|uniref:Short-chain dehydrogenase/reductase SDR n=1 Tax=Stackebrandtia nassauensis (strain DSM 44728 / CIP 108903 / NRRL B-16338 / NBRC 102104 / LLR-40K-21) TaxID=446470 RepID=D3QAC4_STANL|nr:SDR family NAD(P)-dependent oxidoreductase [Stackebrandtia nassauensis]ADD42707.1 short-chain dehydrogenase/reductase SDR [Stackebrandtia nassauensis DSM 44728]
MSAPKVVLVAGASSGIGQAAAEMLAERGHTVFGTSRDPARVKGKGVTPVRLELGDDVSAHRCVSEVADRAGHIDAMVYSAGYFVAGAVEETPAALALAQLEAYLVGAHRLVRAVLPIMRDVGEGRLILMSSSAAVAPIPFHAVYSASKAALEHYAEALRYEVEPLGIDVSCVQGTGVRTAAAANARLTEPVIGAYEPNRTRVIDRFIRDQNEGPSPDTIAAAIVRAVETYRPRARYRVGMTAKTLPLLRGLLPSTVFRRLLARSFGYRA